MVSSSAFVGATTCVHTFAHDSSHVVSSAVSVNFWKKVIMKPLYTKRMQHVQCFGCDIHMMRLAFFTKWWYYREHEIEFFSVSSVQLKIGVYLRLAARYNPSSLGNELLQAALAHSITVASNSSKL